MAEQSGCASKPGEQEWFGGVGFVKRKGLSPQAQEGPPAIVEVGEGMLRFCGLERMDIEADIFGFATEFV